ncbi:MAG: D-2-hydroxyacid dehydrogenase [Candidatus Elarobacter sp.]
MTVRLRIAAHRETAPAFARIAQAGRLPFPLEHVIVEADGSLADAGIRDAAILWRHLGLYPRSWLSAAARALPALRWVHTDHVGIDAIPVDELAARAVVLTNGVGISSRPIAEWIVAHLLAMVKRYPAFVRASDDARWEPELTLDELAGKRILVLGFGSIGSTFAELIAPFGAELIAAARRPRSSLPANVSRFVYGDAWRDEVAHADAIVLTLPATAETTAMIDAATLACMKPTAWIVNVSRGALIDEEALVAALDRKAIGGAALDAFLTEPLPPDSPLWRRPNVIVTPHRSWNTPHTLARMDALFCDNLTRYVGGEPLTNVVAPARGY